MTAPRLRSRSLRRVYKKLPGGRLTIHYERRKPGKAKCANCGVPLLGVPRKRVVEIKKLAKTERRPERPFGGNLCSRCLREKIVEIVRKGLK